MTTTMIDETPAETARRAACASAVQHALALRTPQAAAAVLPPMAREWRGREALLAETVARCAPRRRLGRLADAAARRARRPPRHCEALADALADALGAAAAAHAAR